MEKVGSLIYKWGDQDVEFLSELPSNCLGNTPGWDQNPALWCGHTAVRLSSQTGLRAQLWGSLVTRLTQLSHPSASGASSVARGNKSLSTSLKWAAGAQ